MSTVEDRAQTTITTTPKNAKAMVAQSEETKETYYDVTYRMEILNEVAASISASYFRYMQKHNIDDEDSNSPVAKKCDKVWSFKRQILKCNTLKELQDIADNLRLLQDYIEACEAIDNA